MNKLTAVIVPYGGIDIGYLTTGGIIGLMVVVTLLLIMICVLVYALNKEVFRMPEYYGVNIGIDTGMRIMAILIDILSVVTIMPGGFFYYICIDELISRF